MSQLAKNGKKCGTNYVCMGGCSCCMKLFKTFFPSLKIDFWPYLKLQKMDFG